MTLITGTSRVANAKCQDIRQEGIRSLTFNWRQPAAQTERAKVQLYSLKKSLQLYCIQQLIGSMQD